MVDESSEVPVDKTAFEIYKQVIYKLKFNIKNYFVYVELSSVILI